MKAVRRRLKSLVSKILPSKVTKTNEYHVMMQKSWHMTISLMQNPTMLRFSVDVI